MNILRIEECKKKAGYRSNASIYKMITDGLWPRSIRIGQRSVGWPEFEVDQICKARVAGYTDEQIRSLVDALHLKRIEIEICLNK
jgi:prophage regulatory protein